MGDSLASSVGKSPKISKKVIKELDRQPNGSYMAGPPAEDGDSGASPRTGKKGKRELFTNQKKLFPSQCVSLRTNRKKKSS